MTTKNKIDSNVTGLRFAEETTTIGVLPATPVWHPLEPNSYADFGGQISTVARRPINDSRQQKKGVTTDLDASGGFNTDLTQSNLQQLLQGYMFADLVNKAQTDQDVIGRAGGNVPIIDVDTTADEYTLSNLELTAAVVAAGGTGYSVGDVLTVVAGTFSTVATVTVATISGSAVTTVTITTVGRYSAAPASPAATTGGGTGATLTVTFSPVATYRAGDLIFVAGLGDSANNGLKTVSSVTANTVIAVAENLVTDAAPSATASLAVVGFQFAAGDLDVSAAGGVFPTLTATTKDLTQLGILPGESIFVGGDTALTFFTNSANNGFMRVRSVTAGAITLDKTASTMVTEASTSETMRVFVGRTLKNEQAASIKRRTYNLERTLGAPDAALPAQVQAEYLVGAVPSELALNSPTADKVSLDLKFVATDNEQRTGATGVKSGTRPTLSEADAFNTSSDYSKIKLHTVSSINSNPAALFAFAQDVSLTINNNLSANKAVSVLGAFDVTAGLFQVTGKVTAYFADVAAVSAVRNNGDISIDLALAKQNAGLVIDVPLLSLGDGRLAVELDAPITLPLDLEAADGAKVDATLNHTLMFTFFDYLPTLAEA